MGLKVSAVNGLMSLNMKMGKSLSSSMTRRYPFLKLKIRDILKIMVQISYIKENTYQQ